ncbi:MAG: DUF447 family protein [Candidatus Lokiarchaeota archaeon]|nr:DUF447 family protein [Candidatus Harpocratesius repetitus]
MNELSSYRIHDDLLTFKPFINYESIVCVYFPNTEKKINAACIGVHFTPTNEVYIHAYEDTHTKELLTVGTRFSINFSENFYEYVVAALRRKDHDEPIDELPRSAFLISDSIPILKSAWAAVECEVLALPSSLLEKPVCKRREIPNIRARIIKKEVFRLPVLFNNRSMNLSIEALILVTRIPIYEKYSKEFNDTLKIYNIIKRKIISWRDMERFHQSYELMDNYLIENGVKPQELSFF